MVLHEQVADRVPCQVQFVDAEQVGADHVLLDACRYDPLSLILDESHVRIARDGITLGPIRVRLAYPPELDLMARLAGLRRLRQRWADWDNEPFNPAPRPQDGAAAAQPLRVAQAFFSCATIRRKLRSNP